MFEKASYSSTSIAGGLELLELEPISSSTVSVPHPFLLASSNVAVKRQNIEVVTILESNSSKDLGLGGAVGEKRLLES